MANTNDPNHSLEKIANTSTINLGSSFGSGSFDYSEDQTNNKDILEYSQDDPTINFIVEEDQQEIPFQQIIGMQQQPQKKKHRELFGKYKKKTQEQLNEPARTSGGFMKTFDEVFHLGEFSSQIRQQNNFQKKKVPQSGSITSKYQDSIFIQQNRDTISADRDSFFNCQDIRMNESFNRFSVIRGKNASDERQQSQDVEQLLKIIQQDKQTAIKQVPKQPKQLKQMKQSKQSKQPKQLKQLKQPKQPKQQPQNVPKITFNIVNKQAKNDKGQNSSNEKNVKEAVSSKQLSKSNSSNQIYKKIDIAQVIPNSNISKSPRNNVTQNIKILQPSNSKKHIEKLPQQPKVTKNIRVLANKIVLPGSKIQQLTKYPIFIRQLSKINETYPNFNHPKFQCNLLQHQQIADIIIYFRSVLDFMKHISLQIKNKCSATIKNLQIFKQGFKLEHFLNSGWQNTIIIDQIDKIKPRRPFTTRAFDYEKISKALQNYSQIINHYTNVNVNLETEQGRKKYMSLRNKFWDIERNILMISEDLYSETLRYFYPVHYHEFVQFLKSGIPDTENKNIIQERKYLLAKYLYMKSRNDPLSCSEVGLEVRKKLQTQLKNLCPIN